MVNRAAGGRFHGSSRKTFSIVSALHSTGGPATARPPQARTPMSTTAAIRIASLLPMTIPPKVT